MYLAEAFIFAYHSISARQNHHSWCYIELAAADFAITYYEASTYTRVIGDCSIWKLIVLEQFRGIHFDIGSYKFYVHLLFGDIALIYFQFSTRPLHRIECSD